MKSTNRLVPIITVIFIALIILLSFSVFIVREGQTAIKLRLGQITANNLSPGIHFMVPFIENVVKFDSRLQILDAEPENILTEEKKELVVDYFIEWKIFDTQKFYVSTRGNFSSAENIISQIISDDLRGEFAKRTVNEVVSKDRSHIMAEITRTLSKEVANQGMDVIDVRVKRVDFSENIKDNVFQRMASERYRVSAKLRAEGEERAATITAKTDKEVRILYANANKDAEILQGQGEAKATEIYAKAFTQDEDFYRFQKSLKAYESSFGSKNSTMITTPNSEFFKYLKSE